MGAMTCVVCESDPIERVPIGDRNRVMRPDGTPVFLCSDCQSLVRAGQVGAFTNGALLRLRQFAPLFGIELPPAGPVPAPEAERRTTSGVPPTVGVVAAPRMRSALRHR